MANTGLLNPMTESYDHCVAFTSASTLKYVFSCLALKYVFTSSFGDHLPLPEKAEFYNKQKTMKPDNHHGSKPCTRHPVSTPLTIGSSILGTQQKEMVCIFSLTALTLWQSSANHSILDSTPPTVSIHFVLSETHQAASHCNHIRIDFHGWEENNGNFSNVENVCVPFG